jgi:hypothetical protein
MEWSDDERRAYAGRLRPAERVVHAELSAGEREAFERAWSFSQAVLRLVELERERERWEFERRTREARVMEAAFRRFLFRDGPERAAPWREARRFVAGGVAAARARVESGARLAEVWDSFLSWCVLQTMEGPFVVKRPGREDVVWNWFPGWCDEPGTYGPRVAELAARLEESERRRLAAALAAVRVKPCPVVKESGDA